MPRTFAVTTSIEHTPIHVVQQTYRTLFTSTEGVVAEVDSEFLEVFRVDLSSAGTTVAAATSADEWLKFQALVREWIADRGAMSSITESVMCPAYQSIIGMGETAVPFLIAQLKSEGDEPDQWFWALKVITGEDPVPEQDRGDYLAMARHWLAWAMLEGYAR